MVHIDLSSREAVILREILADKLKDLAKEINRTDHADFKQRLRTAEHAIEHVVEQLPLDEATPS